MNEQVQPDVQSNLQALEPSELQEVSGGYGVFTTYPPLGDRTVVGCGTMVLIDRIRGSMFPTRP